ncbi:MAG: circularly permuted type 2 ATP-grasp protein [Pirellulaceae bacterium]|nr:circularly permuted type 2 ATP-grasp protein [Pirellulaceae bacterium]
MNAPAENVSFTALFSDYKQRAGSYDEAFHDGQLRPHYKMLVGHLDTLGVDSLKARWERAQRQISNDGVTFSTRDAGDAATRPWRLDAIPALLTEQQWSGISAGLIQRARLYEMILADLFTHRTILSDGLLPPEALFANPSFCPAYQNLNNKEQRYLQLFAADMARAPDGQWWVTGDRTRAPFGLGYLLENRIVTSRNLPVPFRKCRVQRLAPFFKVLRESLRDLAPRSKDNPRIVLWTKGPKSQSYAEDAYLARYLGYTLAEGDDLAVRENRVMLKTLGGLLPVEVLLRRLDDDDCDPVELADASGSGVSGLVEVLRCGEVSVANSLGSRVVESPIFLPYIANICRQRFGQDLLIPTVPTWWCGERESRDYVLANLNELLVRPAFRTFDSPATLPGQLSAAARATLIAELHARPWAFVAQQPLGRSTVPVWSEGNLQPWSFALRGFVAEQNGEYVTLPSGLGRVASDPAALEQVMTAGELSQDVWVLSEKPVEDFTLLAPTKDNLALRRSGDDLPSRVADNLFWLGRNVERAEAQARLLRTALMRLTGEREDVPEMPVLLRALAERGQIEPDYVIEELNQNLPEIAEMLPSSAFDERPAFSLRASIHEAVRIASTVRDRVALDLWRIVTRIEETSRAPKGRKADAPEAIAMLDQLVTELVALSGLASESMTRTQAWRFLDLGRRIERATQTAILCRSTMAIPSPYESDVLEAVLVTIDSVMTYRSRYLASIQPAPVIDLVITDETNPRSIVYQLAMIGAHVDHLPRSTADGPRSMEQRFALALLNAVRLADPHELARVDQRQARTTLNKLLDRVVDILPKLADAISGKFLIHAGQQRHYAAGQDAPR